MKLLIIGAGSIGCRHASNAARIVNTAIYDTQTEQLQKCIKNVNNLNYFTDFEQAIKWNPDGAVIATPTHSHIKLAEALIEHGIDVLIEKPISNELTNAQNLLKKAESLGRKIFVSCNLRFHPGVKTLYDNMHKIGKPYFAKAYMGNYLPNMRPNLDYRKLYCANAVLGGGLILDTIHEIDYLIQFFGKVKKIMVKSAKLSDLEIDVEDFAEIIFEHDSNTVSSIQMDYLKYYKRRGCEIVGQKGMLIWQSEGKNPENCVVKFHPREGQSWEFLFESENVNANEMYSELIKNFVYALENGSGYLLTGTDAVEELNVILNCIDYTTMGGMKKVNELN